MAAPDTHARHFELIYGPNVVFHPVGNTPISSAVGAGTPDEQVMQRINGLFNEGMAGKPHLLPLAEELLREFRKFKASGAVVAPPEPLSAADHPPVRK